MSEIIRPSSAYVTRAVKGELEYQRKMEKAYELLYSGMLLFRHEETNQLLPWTPERYYYNFLRAFFLEGWIRWMAVKPRQVYFTNTVSQMMTALAIVREGFRGKISSYKGEDTRSIMDEKFIEPIEGANFFGMGEWKGSADKQGIELQTGGRIIIHRRRGQGRDSKIELVVGGGRGQVADFVNHSEYAKTCLMDPAGAREEWEGSVSGGQYAAHVFDTTSVGHSGEYKPLFENTVEEWNRYHRFTGQKGGPAKKDRNAFRPLFIPWWSKNDYTLEPPPGGFRARSRVAADALAEQDAFRKERGMPPLNDWQKAWWHSKFMSSESKQSVETMNAVYPYNWRLAFSSAADTLYLAPFVIRAQKEQMGGYPPTAYGQVRIAFDLGIENSEMVGIFYQRTGERPDGKNEVWKVLGGVRARGEAAEPGQFLDLLAQQWQIMGNVPVTGTEAVLPWDGDARNFMARKLGSSSEETIKESFAREARERAGHSPLWRNVSFRAIPSIKVGETCMKIKSAFPNLIFWEKFANANFLAPLAKIRQKQHADGGFKTEVMSTKEKDVHDAFGILCRDIQDKSSRRESQEGRNWTKGFRREQMRRASGGGLGGGRLTM